MNEKEKQIEEITKILDSNCEGIPDTVCQENSCSSCKARQIIGVGYSKQSVGEWCKVYRSGVIVKDGWVARCCNNWANRKTQYCPYCGAKMKGA